MNAHENPYPRYAKDGGAHPSHRAWRAGFAAGRASVAAQLDSDEAVGCVASVGWPCDEPDGCPACEALRRSTRGTLAAVRQLIESTDA